MKISLAHYDHRWYAPGAGALRRGLWYWVNAIVFDSWLFPIYGLKVTLLRWFGGRIGEGVVIKPRVKVKYPWRLRLGDHVWIGEGAWIDNLADVEIGCDVCISQDACLLTGNHDYKDPGFGLVTEGITVEDGAWIGARAMVCPGVRVATGAMVTAGSVLTQDTEAWSIYAGNPAAPVRARELRETGTRSAWPTTSEARDLHVAVCFRRLGPYHHARLRAAGARCRLTAIEFSAVDDTNAWARVRGADGFARVTVFHDADVDTKKGAEIRRQVGAALTRVDPSVVVIPGWAHRGALTALAWALSAGRPAVLVSDSTAWDRRRQWSLEAIKRRLVRLHGAALVAGSPHRDYVSLLGLPHDRVLLGYDVVDNEHFVVGARAARDSAANCRRRLKLPERYFVVAGRLIEQKNMARLLESYAVYRRAVDHNHFWSLAIVGDGPLRPDLSRLISELDLGDDVCLAGYRQYDELPIYYGLAGAFVLASVSESWGLVVNEAMAAGLPVLVSKRCGCAQDLVQDGINGFTFDPYDVEQLAGLMDRVATMTDEERQVMGRAGQVIIADWGPERFADGLMNAVEVALDQARPKASWLDEALLWALTHRQGSTHR